MSFCKLSSVGRDYIKYYTDGHLKMVILLVILLVILFPNLNLVILFTPLRGTQLPPLSEEPYAPMGILNRLDEEQTRPPTKVSDKVFIIQAIDVYQMNKTINK